MDKYIIFKAKYPKFLILILTFILAYVIFENRISAPFYSFLLSMGYFGSFFAGLFFVYGFTAAPATAILLILAKEQNLVLAGLIAGLGALTGDFILFKFIKSTFSDEIHKLSKERVFIFFNKHIHPIIKKYFLPVLASFIIATPLPDEIGVSLLAISTRIKTGLFCILSYILNTTGIFLILGIGKII